jgi:serine/threonine-protein kinase ULK4
MNHYHIYAEIGRGKGTTVYKGREKKSIHYVAIKSVEKARKAHILHEVRTPRTPHRCAVS